MRSLPAFLALTLLFGFAGPARADAVPPAPSHCPPGHTPVTDHGGPRCVRNAPKNCPPGWTGILGGQCVLFTCDVGADSRCPSGTQCQAADLCGELRMIDFGWGGLALPPRDNALAGPPHKIDPPRREFYYSDVCNQGKCSGESTCYQAGVCLASGAKLGAKPANAGVVLGVEPRNAPPVATSAPTDSAPPPPPPPPSASGTEAPVPDVDAGESPPATPSASPPSANAPRSGGCSGCTETRTGSALAGGVGLLLAAGLFARRRRSGS